MQARALVHAKIHRVQHQRGRALQRGRRGQLRPERPHLGVKETIPPVPHRLVGVLSRRLEPPAGVERVARAECSVDGGHGDVVEVEPVEAAAELVDCFLKSGWS